MSARALEFVETWVTEQIEDMDVLPEGGDEAVAKKLASQCLQAAQAEDIPASEIEEAFDDVAEFIAGEIEEERERREGSNEDDDQTSSEEEEDE
jgi:hypothetical protein